MDAADDEDIIGEQNIDEFMKYFSRETAPKILMTTNRRPKGVSIFVIRPLIIFIFVLYRQFLISLRSWSWRSQIWNTILVRTSASKKSLTGAWHVTSPTSWSSRRSGADPTASFSVIFLKVQLPPSEYQVLSLTKTSLTTAPIMDYRWPQSWSWTTSTRCWDLAWAECWPVCFPKIQSWRNAE